MTKSPAVDRGVRLLMVFTVLAFCVPPTISQTSSQFPADSIGLDTSCLGSNPPKPCGPGASYAVAGVRSGVSIQEIQGFNSDMAFELADTLGNTVAGQLRWSIISIDVFYEDGLEAGGSCQFDEIWSVTSIEEDTDQCDLTMCTEEGSCFALSDNQVFDISVDFSDYSYTVPFKEQKARVPFMRPQGMRDPRATDANDDEEDGNQVYFSNNDDDDEQGDCSLPAGSTSSLEADANSDGSSCWLACNLRLPSTCASDGSDATTALDVCYSDGNGGIMNALGHHYEGAAGSYRTFSTGGSSLPTTNSNYGCERCLNPGLNFGETPYDLIALYETGGSDSNNPIIINQFNGDACDLASAGKDGCYYGPHPSTWDCRILGDDDEDSTNSDDDSGDADDDDDEDDSTTCRVGSGDNTNARIERSGFGSGISLHDRSLRPLNSDLYRLLTATGFDDGSIVPSDGQYFKLESAAGRSYTALTCGYCNGGQNNPVFKSKRYAQIDTSPLCDVYGIDAINDMTPVWNLDISVAREPPNPLAMPEAPAEFEVRSQSNSRVVSSVIRDESLPSYGSGVSVTVGDQVVNTQPSASLDGVDSVMVCYDSPGNPWKNDDLISYPYERFPNRCAGCTAMNETSRAAPRFWMTVSSETYSYLADACSPSYQYDNGLPVTGSVGFTGAGFIDTATGTSSGDANSGNGGITWNMCGAALDLHEEIVSVEYIDTGVGQIGIETYGIVYAGGATNCRPYQDTGEGGNGFVAEPAYGAARADDFYQTTGIQANAGQLSADDTNAAFTVHDASIFYPPNMRVAPTVDTWVYFDTVTNQGYISTAPLSTREAVGGSTLEEPASSFRVDIYVSSTIAKVGDEMVAATLSIGTNQADLCPLLFPDDGGPDCAAVQVDGGIFDTYSATEVASVCGYAHLSASFLETVNDQLDDYDNVFQADLRFGFGQCIEQGIVPFCLPDSDNDDIDTCGLFLDQDGFSITVPSAEATALQSGEDLYFAHGSSANPASCTSECPIQLEQRFGNRWEIVTTITVQSCSTGGDSIGKANCNPRPSNSPSDSPTSTKTPSSTPSPGSLPSDSSTRTTTASTTPTFTPSTTSTPVETGEADPNGSQTRTPTPRPSPNSLSVPNSISPFATGVPSELIYQFEENVNRTLFEYWYEHRNGTCDNALDIDCNCGTYGSNWDCFVSLLPVIIVALAVVCVCCCITIACCSCYEKRRKSKKEKEEQKISQATTDLYGDFGQS